MPNVVTVQDFKAQGHNPPPNFGPNSGKETKSKKGDPQELKPTWHPFKYHPNHIEPFAFSTEFKQTQHAMTQKFRGYKAPNVVEEGEKDEKDEKDGNDEKGELEEEREKEKEVATYSDIHILSNISLCSGPYWMKLTRVPLTPSWFYEGHLERLRQQNIFCENHIGLVAFNPWEVRSSPGKGKGLFSAKAANVGDILCADYPIQITTKRQDFLALHNRRSEVQRAQFLDLHNAFTEDGSSIYQQISRSNQIQVSLFEGEEDDDSNYAAVFPNISRVNHSCSPNATRRFNKTYLHLEIRATRPIGKDEEVTISYIDHCQPRADRQRELLEKYGFDCMCSKCQEEDATESDNNRTMIAKFPLGDIEVWSMMLFLSDDNFVKRIEEALTTIKQEGLESHKRALEIHLLNMRAHVEIGNEQEAKLAARNCCSLIRAHGGDTGRGFEYDEMLKLITDPHKAGFFGERAARRQLLEDIISGKDQTTIKGIKGIEGLKHIDVAKGAVPGPTRDAIMCIASLHGHRSEREKLGLGFFLTLALSRKRISSMTEPSSTQDDEQNEIIVEGQISRKKSDEDFKNVELD